MRVFLIALLGVVLNLSTVSHAQGRRTKHHHVVQKHEYQPKSSFVGITSWYGKHEQGHRMANGERFDRFKFTAASRTLPLGTRILVTNLETGVSAIVTITDRGPWIKTRILDLAEAPAKKIGCNGLCTVAYTIEHDIETESLELPLEIAP